MEKVLEEKSRCCGCGACMDSCPFVAIWMKEDGEGFLYPQIDVEKCTDCGRCREVCPIGKAIGVDGEYGKQGKQSDNGGQGRVFLGVRAKEDKIRFESSSGGVFPVLAEYVLSKGGVVFGAVMEKGGRVVHRDIHSASELAAMQKTKYVQSDLKGCFRKVKRYLEEGRRVLFSGTPCQCQAVKLYIGNEAENLLLADLVCYGVPSPGIWKKYVRELEKKYGGVFAGFSFRDKRKKDNGHTMALQIREKEYTWPMNQDAYCRLYFRNAILRPSCHFCDFCRPERESDLTMGDFWGIEKVRPDMDDGMGTSLVILHSEKARKVWEEIKEAFHYFQCGREDILQPRLCRPTPVSGRRKYFMMLNRFLSVHLAEKILR